MGDARIAQLAVETAYESSADAQVELAQIAVETTFLDDAPPIAARVAQIAVETVYLGEPAFEEDTGFLVEAELEEGVWTQIPVLADPPLDFEYGIQGRGPLDVVAGPGACKFSVNNDSSNGNALGWYSPQGPNVRDGWGLGTPIRVTFTHPDLGAVRMWTGFVGDVRPEGGKHLIPRAHVVCYDAMFKLMRADVREIQIASNTTDSDLIDAILDAVPETSRPAARNLDVPYDTYPYAFDNLGSGNKALAVLGMVAQSGSLLVYADRHGTLVTKNRSSRFTDASRFRFNDTMHGIDVPTSVQKSYNRVRTTIHPRSVGSAPVVLYAEQSVVSVYPTNGGAPITFWADYRDANDVRTLLGGVDIAQPVAYTDYEGNSLPDGSGADLTGNLSITVTPFASTALVEIENTGSQDIYLVNGAGQPLFRFLGTPVYNDIDRTFESFIEETYGDNVLDVDLVYQADATVGKAFADFYGFTYRRPEPIESMTFFGRTDELYRQILQRTIGDRITVAETATGIDAEVLIASIRVVAKSNDQYGNLLFECTYGLVPAPSGAVAPPAGSPDPSTEDVTVTFTGAANGSWNLTQDGPLALTTPGDYALAFSRFGVDIRVKGVAGGATGGFAQDLATPDATGAGGASGASNLTGVVIPLTQTNYSAKVGFSSTDGSCMTQFRALESTILLELDAPDATVGAGSVDGSPGAAGVDVSTANPGNHGTGGVTGSGASGGAMAIGGNGGNGSTQAGGDGASFGDPSGDNPSPEGFGQAEGAGGSSFGGGAGGGVLLGGVYAGGGGGGCGYDGINGIADQRPGRGGQGVLTIELD